MFASIAARYDLTNTILSFGMHYLWRRALLRLLPAEPSGSHRSALLVLDVCTGTGDLLPLIKHRFGEVVGVDFCRPMLLAGRGKQRQRFEVVQGDALQLPFPDSTFDLLTAAFGVRNLEAPDRGCEEFRRVLKPGGRLLVLEFGQPRSPLFGVLFRAYAQVFMPLIGGLLTGSREAYVYLPRTAAQFPCAQEFLALLERAGFEDGRYIALSGGIAYAYCAAARQPLI